MQRPAQGDVPTGMFLAGEAYAASGRRRAWFGQLEFRPAATQRAVGIVGGQGIEHLGRRLRKQPAQAHA